MRGDGEGGAESAGGLAGRAFVVLCVVSFLSGFATAPFGSLFPVYVDQDLGRAPFYTGYLRAVMLALGGLFAVVAGRLCDLVGLKPTLLLGVLGSVVTGLVFHVSSLFPLTLLVVFMGLASGCSSTAGQSYLIASAGAERLGLGGALYFLSSTTGNSLGSLCTGLVKDSWSFQQLGSVMTAGMVVVLAVAVLCLPSGSRRPGTERDTSLALWSAYRPLLRRRQVHLLVALRLSITGFWGMAIFILPLLVFRVSESAPTAAYYSAISLAVASCGQLLIGALRDRYGRFWPLLVSAGGIVASALLLGVYCGTLRGLLVFGTALTATAWAVSTLVPALIDEVAGPAEKSRLVGLGHMAWSTAMVGGSLAGGILVEVDASLPFFTGAGMATVGTACAFFLCRSLDRPVQRPGSQCRGTD